MRCVTRSAAESPARCRVIQVGPGEVVGLVRGQRLGDTEPIQLPGPPVLLRCRVKEIARTGHELGDERNV